MSNLNTDAGIQVLQNAATIFMKKNGIQQAIMEKVKKNVSFILSSVAHSFIHSFHLPKNVPIIIPNVMAALCSDT